MDSATTQRLLEQAHNAASKQARAIELTSASLDASFPTAAHLLATSEKVVTTGLGKSGFIARKMAATLTSLRLPAVYLHPVDALHGDSGLLSPLDVMVAFSKSGETSEVLRLANHAADLGLRIIAITGRPNTSLAGLASATILARIESELDPLDLIPTASTTTALMVADLLTLAAADLAGATTDGLRVTHPHGAIGNSLLRTVDEVMHTGPAFPHVRTGTPLSSALAELTAKGLGAVCILDDKGALAGLLTDGDVRRLVTSGRDLGPLAVDDVMTQNPITIHPSLTLHEALNIMERRQRQINVLAVVRDGECVGLVRLHDVVRANL
jgi:arabinose-5-phosphate isomerase